MTTPGKSDSQPQGPGERDTILITGAARRLGRALALAIGARGSRLILHYNRSRREAESLAAELAGVAGAIELIGADLSQPEGQDHLVAKVRQLGWQLTGLVNNASNFYKTPLADLDRDAWDAALAVNLTAPLWLAAVLGNDMKSNAGGGIVMVGDWSTARPYRDYLAYSVSKGGLETGTRALARELAPEVRINLVAPGPILLPPDSSPEYEARVHKAVPLGRLGGSEAYVSLVMRLLSNAPYCTGTILTMDGGRHLC
jgi:pteridine reductase